MKKIILFVLMGVFAINIQAQISKNIAGSLDSLIQQFPSDGPGGVLIIAQNSQQIYHREFGLANIELKVPIHNETIFEAASVSKQFAATAALLLINEGKLNLDDDVRKYIPELPDYGKKITIKHLLTHTSGLKDWRNVTYLTQFSTGKRIYNQIHAKDLIIKQTNLNHAPGDRYSYTNAGYDLIGIIIERITKKSFRDFVSERLLKPAQMNFSNFRYKHTDVIPNFSTSYNGTPKNYSIAYILDETYGAAGLHTTADDLRKWNFYINGKAGDIIKDLRLERFVLNNGQQITYTSGGVNVNHVEGVKEIIHSGLLGGYRSLCVYYPEYDLSFTYMSNTRNINSSDIHHAVFKILFNKTYTKPLPPTIIYNFEPSELNFFKGQYYNPEDLSEYLTFSVNNNTLINYQARLTPISKQSFLFEKNVYHFSSNGDTLQMNRSGANAFFLKALDYNPTEKELIQFTGSFYSKDVEGQIDLIIENNKLIISNIGGEKIVLDAAYQRGNEFAFRGFVNGLRMVLIFTKPTKGSVQHLMIHLPRANHIPYSRVK